MGRLTVAAMITAVLLSGCSPAPGPGATTPAGPSPTATGATGSASPTTSPTATETQPADPACDFLPDGVDPRACATPPSASPPIPNREGEPEAYSFTTDNGRIRCDAHAEGEFVACAFGVELSQGDAPQDCDAGDWDNNFVYLSKDTSGDWGAGQGACRSDPLTAETTDPPELPQDTILAAGDVAVVAGPNSITAWNAEAKHGFAVTDGKVVTW